MSSIISNYILNKLQGKKSAKQLPSSSPLPPFDGDMDACPQKQWTYLAGKPGGQNEAGSLGGLYSIADGNPNVYLKQDPEQDKNIAEVFASQFMRFIAEEIGENPDIIANVNYVRVNPENVYVASEVFDGYRDLFLDAYLAYQLPLYKELRTAVGDDWQILPTKRPRYLQRDVCIDNMMKAGRYKHIIPGMALRTIVDDPDLHFENIGAVPIEPSGEDDLIPIIEKGKLTGKFLCKKSSGHADETLLEINGKPFFCFARDGERPPFKEAAILYNNKHYLIPNVNNSRAAGIDFGGAFGDFRSFNPRKFDGKIHTNKLLNLIRYRLSSDGPPSYHDQIPVELSEGNEFFKTLARFSMVDKKKIRQKIEDEIDQAIYFYKKQPEVLLRFAERIGATIPDSFASNTNLIGEYIKEYLYNNFASRQQHCKALFLDNFCRLNRNIQINLMNGYFSDDIKSEVSQNEQMMALFFRELKEENQLLFRGLEQIDHLIDNQIKTLGKVSVDLAQLQKALHNRLCKAYFKGDLEKESLKIDEIIFNTYKLLHVFKKTTDVLASDQSSEIKAAAAQDFLNMAAEYDKKYIHSSTQKFVVAACAVVGALVGIVLGAALGVLIGALVGGTLGNIFGAIGGGSVVGVVTALKGAGIGAAVGTVAASLLLGTTVSYSSAKVARHLMFSHTNESMKALNHSLGNKLEDNLEALSVKNPK